MPAQPAAHRTVLNLPRQPLFWAVALGHLTTDGIRLTYERGRATPVLHVALPARPKDKDEKVEKQTFIFHVTLRNLW